MAGATGGSDDQQIKNLRMGMETVINTLPHVLKVLDKKEDNTDRKKIIDELRSTIRAYIEQEKEYQESMDALANTRLQIRDEIRSQEEQVLGEDNSGQNQSKDLEKVVDVDKIFNEAKQKLPQVSKNYADKHPKMKEFESRLAIELRSILDQESGKEEDSGVKVTEDAGGEIIATETINTMDPITRQEMTDPVKNTLCGHTYDRASILQIIKKNPRTKCPMAGCANKTPVNENNLISDSDVLYEIQKKNRRSRK